MAKRLFRIGRTGKRNGRLSIYTLAITDSDPSTQLRGSFIPIEDPTFLDLIQIAQKHVMQFALKNSPKTFLTLHPRQSGGLPAGNFTPLAVFIPITLKTF